MSSRPDRDRHATAADPFLRAALTEPRTFLDRLVLALALAPPPARSGSPFSPVALRRRRGGRTG